MKRIVFFSGDITRGGGTERVGILIANALADCGDSAVSVVSLTHGAPQPAFFLSPSIRREALSDHWVMPGPGYLPVIFRLKKYVKRQKADLIIDIDGVLDILSLPGKWMTGVRVISWEHFNYHYFDQVGSGYRNVIRRLAARYADAIVVLTERDRGFYLEHLKIRHEIRVIHNPADYLEPDQSGRVRLSEKKELLSVGGLVDAKGFVRVPLIAHNLKEHYPSLDFVWSIAGEGEQRAEIEGQIRECGVQDQVKLLGRIADVSPLYDQADLYVMTSKREGLPMVLLEAKQYGLPIVSYDILTGPSEVIDDGVNGRLIPETGDEQKDAAAMADAIGRLLTDEALYDSFAQHARDHIEDFLLEPIVEQWKELLELVLSGKLDIDTAAETCGITPEEFQEKLAKAKKQNR